MEVHFPPELEAKLNDLATETGRATDEVVRDAVAGYFDDLAQLRNTLDRRYDELQSGEAELVDGEEVFARLRRKSAERHAARR
jgi:predicted DNA-binding protein